MTITERIKEIADKATRDLMEHCHSVKVFVTFDDEDNAPAKTTRSYETGDGNFYAQLGQITEWLAIQDQYQRDWAGKKAEKPITEEGEKEL